MDFIIGFIIGGAILFCITHKPTREWFKRYLQKQREKKREGMAFKASQKPKKRAK